jgi:hypothetical protein
MDQYTLKQWLRYEPDTGKLFWIKKPRGAVQLGDEAGCKADYIVIRLLGVCYVAQRLIWLYENGSFPPDGYMVDHKDQNKHNNILTNLRLATATENRCNHKLYDSNKSGYTGVFRRGPNKFTAFIRYKNKRYHIGQFGTAKKASIARDEYARKLHCGFATLNET